MRRRILYLILLLTVMCAACSSPQDDVVSAAMDVYEQYANHSSTLTVAYIGDYTCNDYSYNAVMLQTSDSAEWDWLRKEFGVVAPVAPAQGGIMMGDPSMVNADATNAPQGGHGVVMASLEIDTTRDFKDTAEFLAYVDSLSRAMLLSMGRDTAGLRATMVFNADSMQSLPENVSAQQIRMDHFTRKHGDAGYMISADYDTRTLWLFFFGNADDQQSLMAARSQAAGLTMAKNE